MNHWMKVWDQLLLFIPRSSLFLSLSYFILPRFVFLPAFLNCSFFRSPLTHSEILTEMLNLAGSTSAPELAPKASEQEAEDSSKTWLSNAQAHVHAQIYTPTQAHSSFILIHSFFLTCRTERLNKCAHKHACMHAHAEEHRPTKQDILARLLQGVCQPLCQFYVPSYVNRSLRVTSICLNERDKRKPEMARISSIVSSRHIVQARTKQVHVFLRTVFT